jgi:predicted nucleotidyltransferase
MKKILTARLHFFRREEHYEYLIVFRSLMLKFPAVQTLVSMYYDAFVNLIGREEQIINTMRKSDYTEQIVEAAHRVDRLLVGMHETIAAALHHFDPVTVKAAQSLYNRVAAFGDIARKSYEEKIPDVDILIDDLQSEEYAEKVSAVGLSPWLSELRNAEAAFKQLLVLRNTEYSRKPRERFRDVRGEADIIYRRMTGRINAAATLDDAAGTYDVFIAQLNAEITYFNNHTHHRARKNLSAGGACLIDSIAAQTYTGKAITPVPAAYYRQEGKPAVELVFAKDFFVTYRNNVNAGTADLILHGKGAYRGQKKTTFTIARV